MASCTENDALYRISQKLIYKSFTHDIYIDETSNTKHIIFSDKFNEKVKIDKSITHITFGPWFNHSINNLREGVVYIKFGHFFNKKTSLLPESVEYLEYGTKFNKKIDRLPKNIKTLILGVCFNKSIDKIPKHIHSLSLYEFILPNCIKLPKYLENLTLNNIHSHVKVKNKSFYTKTINTSTKLKNINIDITFGHFDFRKYKNFSFRLSNINVIKDNKSKISTCIKKIPYGCKYTQQ